MYTANIPGREEPLKREDIRLFEDYPFKYHAMEDENIGKYILEVILEETINSMRLLDKEVLGSGVSAKTHFADYKVCINENTDIQMEMQNLCDACDIDRIIHYFARLVEKGLNKGEGYHHNRKVLIWIHNYPMKIATHQIINKYNILHSTHYQILTIDLSNLKSILNKDVMTMTKLERLCIYLRYSHDPEFKDVINNIVEAEEGVALMETRIQETTQNPNNYYGCQDLRAYFDKKNVFILQNEVKEKSQQLINVVSKVAKEKGISLEKALEEYDLKGLI